ncbi:DUF4129 domain-containing protein [Tenacibaculum aestuariivivum]|uniref:DUF4129 domain-containing protein n=1 Tax=Tenacibaculum aestuariivivum TaxID=2006131 RepID=UPI003AB3FCDE
MKHLLFYIIFLFFSVSVFSQTAKNKVKFDTLNIELQKFDAKKITTYKQQKDFIYITKKSATTVLDKLWNWGKRVVKKIVSYFFDDIKPVVGFLKVVLKILPYITAGIILFLILKFFLKVNFINILGAKKAKAIVSLSDEEILINKSDLPTLINKAINNQNYKLATRYYYLLLLKNLSENELISWQQEKTNEDYIRELSLNKILYKDFKKLSHLYDYVWYGEFLIDKEKFLQAEASFKKIIAKI